MKKNLKLSLCAFGLLAMFAAEANAGNNSDGTPCEDICVFLSSQDGYFNYGSGTGYQRDNIGTYVPCNYTYEDIDGGTVWNFNPNRILYINNRVVRRGNGNITYVPARRNGGYCIHTSMGESWTAGWRVWEE